MSRFSKGWVKAWREAVEGDLPQNIWLWGIWNWLLLSATWKPSKILWNGKQREIPAGTVIMGLVELSAKWGCSKNTIKKWLSYLEKTDRISLETCTRGTLITIRNWELYQTQDQSHCTPSEREVNTNCTPSEHEVTLNEEIQESKKKREREEKKLRPDEINQAIEEWGKTLSHHKIQKDPRLDEVEITRLILINGIEKTKLALRGAAFEEKSQDYDPSNHVSIRRLLRPDIFEKFVNLGAKNKPTTTRQYHEDEAAC